LQVPMVSETTEKNEQIASSNDYRFRHFPQLDGFRGLAIVLVMCGHIMSYESRSPRIRQAGDYFAHLGVFLFFVLSGFLITGLLHRERSLKGNVDLKWFYIRRVLRLGPALFVFLFAVILLRWSGLLEQFPRYEILACFLFVRNFFGKNLVTVHLWSLSLEEQFYLFWPNVYKRLKFSNLLAPTLFITFGIALWRGVSLTFGLVPDRIGLYYMRPYFRFDSILIGCCLALALATSGRFLQFARKISNVVPAGLFWIALASWTVWGESVCNPLYLTLQMLLISALLAQLVLRDRGFTFQIFSSPVSRYLGQISYSLYLWQELFLVVESPSWGVLRRFPVNIICSIAAAAVSYRFIEKPVLDLKSKFQ
jgi:peptidoglycan/LPS O-acetylase OafA/YrhL